MVCGPLGGLGVPRGVEVSEGDGARGGGVEAKKHRPERALLGKRAIKRERWKSDKEKCGARQHKVVNDSHELCPVSGSGDFCDRQWRRGKRRDKPSRRDFDAQKRN